MRAVLAAFLALACAAPQEPAAESPASPSPPRVSRAEVAARLDNGIDVSNHSGAVDWKQVRDAGHSFAIAKASEGVDSVVSTATAFTLPEHVENLLVLSDRGYGGGNALANRIEGVTTHRPSTAVPAMTC